jgi:transposase
VRFGKKLATETFKRPASLALYDLTSVYFEVSGPAPLARYGHSRDHSFDRPQIILAFATDTHGTPLHISILRGTAPTPPPCEALSKILRRRFQIQDVVFVFDGGMSSKMNLQLLEDEGLEFVTRLSNSTLEALLKKPPGENLL